MAKLTKTVVDRLPHPPKGYALQWDEQDRGFGVRITSEGKKTYVVQGRARGKELRLTIGPHGVFTVAQAREVAREHLRTMRLGVDPRQVQKEARAVAVTLREVADAYQRDRPLKPRSKAEIERHVTTSFQVWLQRPIASITREAVTKRFNELKSVGLRGNGPAPHQANQAFSVLRALINYAIREYRKPDGSPLIPDNPVDVLYKKWNPVRPRTSRVPERNVGAVWNLLTELRESPGTDGGLASVDLVTFLLLTGARIGEARALTWDRVNLDEAWWHLPDPKNSNPVWLPLSQEAVDLIRNRPRSERNPYVFASWGESGHLIDPRETMRKVSVRAGTPLSPHDLRRTFTTVAVACCGIDLHKVELLTNHVPKGVTARHYLETSYLQYLRPEVQRIADWVVLQARIAKDMEAGGNVVALRA